MIDLRADLLRSHGLCTIELSEDIERHIVLIRRAQPAPPAVITAITEAFAEVVRQARDQTRFGATAGL
jgi:hypothetical protein